MPRSLRSALVLIAFVVAGLVSGPASANKEKARELYRRGMAKYVLDKWDLAIADFEAGFQEEPLPPFLYNIAQAHKKAGRPREAITYFKKFLDLDPESRDKAEVEKSIAEMEKELAGPDVKTLPDGQVEYGPIENPDAPKAAEVQSEVPVAAIVAAPIPAAKPARRRWPIWVGVAAGVVVAAGAATGIYFLTQPSSEPSFPTWSLR